MIASDKPHLRFDACRKYSNLCATTPEANEISVLIAGVHMNASALMGVFAWYEFRANIRSAGGGERAFASGTISGTSERGRA